ncbi:MAG: glycine oxidase ThiO [Pseudomonadales bacterium]|nr:glycine oxidase ThiO [Pseudomonadales bacterium]
MTDVLIVGGGVIGLLLAKDLVQRSVTVKLVEQGEIGAEASWAGGGIVSPLYPWTYSDPITALASWAQNAYPELAQELKGATGVDPEFNPCGLLMLDPPEKDRIVDWADSNQKQFGVLNRSTTLQKEPALEKKFSEAVWWPQIGNIRNPRLLQSLVVYLQGQRLCSLEPHSRVTGIQRLDSGRVQVSTPSKTLSADKVVVCAGAWAGDLLAGMGIDVAIQPVKGQMMVFEPRPGLINSIILHEGRYLIPRLDGRIVVGSTLEHTGYDKTTTNEARDSLLEKACELVPALRSVPVEAHWAGLRPGAPHGIPYIGSLPGWDNVFVNAGHFRNGLVLAPASVRLMTNILLGEEPIVDPSPYHPLSPRPSGEMF